MKKLLNEFEVYLYKNILIKAAPKPWNDVNKLPLALKETYNYFTCDILNEKCLLLIPENDTGLTPAKIKKHIDTLYKKYQLVGVYLNNTISNYNRQRFILQKIPFLIPGNQMYLPFLGIDLRDYYKKEILNVNNKMNPSTQVVLLYIIYNGFDNELGVNLLANKLKYSSMSVTRAFDEIEALGFADTKVLNRKRILNLQNENNMLWEECKNKMSSPVKERRYIQNLPLEIKALKSGLTALSENTMINEPAHEVYAMSQSEWKKAKMNSLLKELPTLEEGGYEIEVWSYDPKKLTDGDTVDHLSLYLEFKNSSDERIEAALEELMETMEW